jgi:hypothetical protein
MKKLLFVFAAVGFMVGCGSEDPGNLEFVCAGDNSSDCFEQAGEACKYDIVCWRTEDGHSAWLDSWTEEPCGDDRPGYHLVVKCR